MVQGPAFRVQIFYGLSRGYGQPSVGLAGYAGQAVTEENVAAVMTRLALASVAETVVVPVQDILGLGMEGRMNTPSTREGNWCWRLAPGQLSDASMTWFMENTTFFGRNAGIRKEA